MKLLLDQNLSRKIINKLEKLYPGSSHVYLLGMQMSSDAEIWTYAFENRFTIVTQDSDFYERSLLFGFPPKVIWLRVGNTSTENIEKLLRQLHTQLLLFEKDKTLGCFQILNY